MTAPATDERPGGLLAWQWSLYPRAHTTHPNLAVHALTAPFFVAGTVALLASPWVRSLGLALGGAAAMVAVMLVQMRSHRTEPAALKRNVIAGWRCRLPAPSVWRPIRKEWHAYITGTAQR